MKGKEVPRGRHCAAWSLQLRQALMADTALAPTTAFNTPISPSITHDRLSLISDFETKQQRMASAKLALWLGVAGMIVLAGGGAETIAEKCAAEFQKVTQCLSFVTAKAAAPSKDCCSSVTELKDTDPACLCYIIEQVHNGSNPAVKSMGVQESRLLQLPSACKLANASITECPKLLNLPPNSPDAAIFTNASTGTGATTTPVATPGGTSSPTTAAPSKGEWHKPQVVGCLTVAMAIFFHAFPLGLMMPF